MPLFNPVSGASIITPSALYTGEPGSMSAGAGSANTAYLQAYDLYAQVTLTGLRIRFGTGGAGHYDVGIYDASGTNNTAGTLLAHAASTATSLATASGSQTPALIGGNVVLSAGRYWLAFWVDNATDTIVKVGSGNNTGQGPNQTGTTTGPLPASASSLTSVANTGVHIGIIGLLSGGWS